MLTDVRTVTILFTDLVDSTQRATNIAPDDADAQRRHHFSALRQALDEHDGTEVKNLGDGLMVVFERPSSALACAVSMQQRVAAIDGPDAMRVGISAGETTHEEDDWFGDPVVEAARLCGACAPGQILVAELVVAMAGRRAKQVVREVGELELKGLPEPVATLEVTWEPAATTVQLPPRLQLRPTIGFVGRDEELATLLVLAKSAMAGEGAALALIGGEPGMGKTTLAGELALALEAEATVLYGHCDELGGGVLQPFVEALTPAVAAASERLLADHVQAHGSDLIRVLPALGRRLPDVRVREGSDPDSDRHLLFESTIALIGTLCRERPLVLVLDDLQWADEASLSMTKRLAEHASTTDLPLLVVGTFRDTELDRGDALSDTLASLRRLPNVTRVQLTGLDAAAILRLLERGAGHELGDDGNQLALELADSSDGNPFFLNELFWHLADSGMVAEDADGRWIRNESIDDVALPGSVREVIGQRVDRLGGEARDVLAAAAVMGREFELDVLELVVDVAPDRLLDLLDAACAAALVAEDETGPGRYLFSHALSQQTLSQDLTATRRARLHEQVAAAMEQIHGPFPRGRVRQLAGHWLATGRPKHRVRALAYARAAGDEALSGLAPADAVTWYSSALDLCEQSPDQVDPADVCDVLIGLGKAQRQIGGDYSAPLHRAFAMAREAGDHLRMAMAALSQSRGSQTHTGQANDDWREELTEAIAATAGRSPDLHAKLLATLAAELSFDDRDRRMELADQALASVAEHDLDAATELFVLNSLYIPLREPSTLDRRRELTDRALALAEVVGDPVQAAAATAHAAMDALDRADRDAFQELTAQTRELAVGSGVVFEQWRAGLLDVLEAILAGSPDEAEARATETLQVGLEGSVPEAMMDFGVHLMVLRRMQGRLGEMAESLVGALGDFDAMPAARLALASVQAELGDVSPARELLDQQAPRRFDLIPQGAMWLGSMLGAAETAAAIGHREACRVLHELINPYGEQVANSIATVDGSVRQVLGLLASALGNHDEADGHFAAALVVNRDQLRAPYFTAATQLAWGVSLLEREAADDRRDEGKALVEQALATAESRGFVALAERARTALAA